MLAFSEGLLLAQRDGVNLQLAAEVMSNSPIGSPMLKARIPPPSAAVADQMLTKAGELGYEHRDIAALREVLAKTAPR